jgi:hypothetical protein
VLLGHIFPKSSSSSLYPVTPQMGVVLELKGYPQSYIHAKSSSDAHTKLSENRPSGVHSGYHSLQGGGGSEKDTRVIPG